MMKTVSKKCGCGASLPLNTKVGDFCPSCGAQLVSETNTYLGPVTGPGNMSDSRPISRSSVMILLIVIFALAFPPIMASLFEGSTSAFLFFSAYLGETSIIASAAMIINSIIRLRDRSFDWKRFRDPLLFFTGIIWFLINGFFIFIIFRVFFGFDSGSTRLGIEQIGWVSLVICGPLSVVCGAITSMPIYLISRKKK